MFKTIKINNDQFIDLYLVLFKKLVLSIAVSKFWKGDPLWWFEGEISKHFSLLRIDIVEIKSLTFLNIVFLIFSLKVGW